MLRAAFANLLITIGLLTMTTQAQEPFNAVIHVHDPVMIKQGDTWYLFSTGPGVQIRKSRDLVHWEFGGSVFEEPIPPSAKERFPRGSSTWAPDITFFNGRYHLYYAVSRFGTNESEIGLATNATLDQASKDYKWVDKGPVIETRRGDDYNAIDGNLVFLGEHRVAMVLGSFWSGIKLVELDWQTGKQKAGATMVPIASRPGSTAVEGPYILKHGRYFYLFVSFDLCCRGVNSTYNIRVGRSAKAEGPYLDKDGKPMLEGGGTLLLGTEGSWIGPGHCSVYTEPRRCLLVYHFYDGNANGVPTLQIRPMSFGQDGWPALGAPLGAPAAQ